MQQRDGAQVPTSAVEELWTTALSFSRLQSYLEDFHRGYRDFKVEGNRICLPYRGNRDLYALGSFLGPAESKESTAHPRLSLEQSRRLSQWVGESGGRVNWFDAPDWAREPIRHFTGEIFSAFPADLATHAHFGPGLATADLVAYQLELASLCFYESLMCGSGDPLDVPAIAPILSRKAFIRHMCEATQINEDGVSDITDLLTMDPTSGVDPALTPLIPTKDGLVPMSGIISLTPQRTLLRLLQTEKHRRMFGRIGHVLGDEGEDAAAALLSERMTDSKVEKRIPVTRKGGDSAGDLDVVVCSPSERTLVVFETKWGIGVEPSFNDLQFDGEALPNKREQVRRLQRELDSKGTTVGWPVGWPDTSEYDWFWALLTRYVLPETPAHDDSAVPSVSHQVLKWTLRNGASVGELLHLIYDPPIPDVTTRWEDERLGKLEISVELMDEPSWPPGCYVRTG